MKLDELAGLVALTEIGGIGEKRALELYRAFGSIDDLLDSPQAAFSDHHYVDEEAYDQLQSLHPAIDDVRRRFDRCQANGIDVIGIEDARYPPALAELHAPLVIYAKGDSNLLGRESVSFSGSRETNVAGQDWVRHVAGDLASEGYAIVSGGARGADTAAHEGALDADGATVVVLGTGVETPYPEENVELFDDIVAGGGTLISHRPPAAGPTRAGFLNRNKTLSALSAGLVIVATDGSGGTMAQYNDATAQERQVFVPSRATDVRPYDGIEDIAREESTMIVDSATEIEEWYNRSNSAPLSTRRDDTEGKAESGNGQASLADWGRGRDAEERD